MSLILQALSVIIGLGFLVFIHELGHFLAAKMCKVNVVTFAFGFGPDLIKHTYKGTKYCIKAVPFGGFIGMAGETPDKATGAEGEYLSLVWYKKIWILFAGPFSNYIFAIFLFAFIFNVWGIVHSDTNCSIGYVVENSSAALAGLRSGDKIKSIDAVEINTWSDLIANLRSKAGKYAYFIIERGNNSFELNMLVAKNSLTKAGEIGVRPLKTKISFMESACLGIKFSIQQTVLPVIYLVNRVVSLKKPDISGPVGIIRLMADAAREGVQDYLKLIAFISIALGLFNLFPIPMVDGGMILLFLVEGIIRKQINAKVIQVYNTIGLILISAIFLLATYNDLLQLNIMKLFVK
ncbi:MAG: M50 family metallopeptidase [Endomicrobium sp.]|jgi:regulator of sigma E protease|nr:M50 family metallopeptidase [Endomicrobium sp.]